MHEYISSSSFFNNALHLDPYQVFLKPLLGYPRISMVSPQPIPSAFLQCVLGVTLPWDVSRAKTWFRPSGRLLPQCYSLVCAEAFWFHTTLLVNSGYHFLGNWSPLQRALASACLEELPLCFFPLFRVADCTLRSFFMLLSWILYRISFQYHLLENGYMWGSLHWVK